MSVPVTILTGFLGSGKTTVLQKILAQENYGDTAVLVNEFGEVGIDQQLVAPIAPNVVLLDSGCLCCSVRGELTRSLGNLFRRALSKEAPVFDRVLIETTDGQNTWVTVGVGANVVEASWGALVDAFTFGLRRQGL